MIVLIMGAQGSGKGTQAEKLSHEFNLFNFDSGRFLRELAKARPDIDAIVNTRGALVSDDEIFELIKTDLESHRLYDDILFDGFPRSIGQFELLNNWLATHNTKLTAALYISVSREESLKRLSARRIHRQTGEVYNLITNPPPSEVRSEDLEQREDDTPEAISHRLDLYHEVTGPLVEHLRKLNLLYEVNGEQSIEAIHQELIALLTKIKNEQNTH